VKERAKRKKEEEKGKRKERERERERGRERGKFDITKSNSILFNITLWFFKSFKTKVLQVTNIIILLIFYCIY